MSFVDFHAIISTRSFSNSSRLKMAHPYSGFERLVEKLSASMMDHSEKQNKVLAEMLLKSFKKDLDSQLKKFTKIEKAVEDQKEEIKALVLMITDKNRKIVISDDRASSSSTTGANTSSSTNNQILIPAVKVKKPQLGVPYVPAITQEDQRWMSAETTKVSLAKMSPAFVSNIAESVFIEYNRKQLLKEERGERCDMAMEESPMQIAIDRGFLAEIRCDPVFDDLILLIW